MLLRYGYMYKKDTTGQNEKLERATLFIQFFLYV